MENTPKSQNQKPKPKTQEFLRMTENCSDRPSGDSHGRRGSSTRVTDRFSDRPSGNSRGGRRSSDIPDWNGRLALNFKFMPYKNILNFSWCGCPPCLLKKWKNENVHNQSCSELGRSKTVQKPCVGKVETCLLGKRGKNRNQFGTHQIHSKVSPKSFARICFLSRNFDFFFWTSAFLYHPL